MLPSKKVGRWLTHKLRLGLKGSYHINPTVGVKETKLITLPIVVAQWQEPVTNVPKFEGSNLAAATPS
jgi:hypothetical protein